MAGINPTAAVVLGMLQLGPAPSIEGYGSPGTMTGWQMHEMARASVGGFWTLTRSQIYVELERLARAQARPDQLRSPLTLLVFFGELLPPALLRRALADHRLLRERRLEEL